MTVTIADIVSRWDLEGHSSTTGEQFNQIHARLVFFQQTHYYQYIPTLGTGHPDFEARLGQWLDNLTSESDKRLLFEVIPHITFFTREDFIKLHQVARDGPIARWIIDILKLQLDDPNLTENVDREIHEHTWFCPISDSMQIGEFHHANNIGGIDFRPDWRSLAQFADRSRVLSFMSNHKDAGGHLRPLRRIVLLDVNRRPKLTPDRRPILTL
jgi:hypothetical protein